MTKEIHWLLESLNDHLYHLDKADKAYPQLQDLCEEILMWRKRYADEQQYTELEKNTFISLATEYFIGRTPLEVYTDFVQVNDG